MVYTNVGIHVPKKLLGVRVNYWMKHLEHLSRNKVLRIKTLQRHPTGSVVCPTHQDLLIPLSCPTRNRALRGNTPRPHIRTPHKSTESITRWTYQITVQIT